MSILSLLKNIFIIKVRFGTFLAHFYVMLVKIIMNEEDNMKVFIKTIVGMSIVASSLFASPGDYSWERAAHALEASDKDEGDYFGWSISRSENYAVVGAPSDSMGGSAYVFQKEPSGDWTQMQKLHAPAMPVDSYIGSFGKSVAIAEPSGGSFNDNPSLLVVGAPGSEKENAITGAICIYKLDTTWKQQGECTMGVSNSSEGSAFGYSVAISNWLSGEQTQWGAWVLTPQANIVVGDPGWDMKYANHGLAVFYDYNVTSDSLIYVALTTDHEGTGGSSSDVELGKSVALYDGTAIIAAPGLKRPDPNDDPEDDFVETIDKMGRVYFFTSDGDFISGYTPPHEETDGEHQFGYSVDIFGDHAIVGEKHKEGDLSDGAVYIMKNDGGWNPVSMHTSNADGYGFSVSISNQHAAVGAPHTGTANGTIVMYTNSNDTWSETERFSFEKMWALGISVELYDDTLMVGAPLQERVERFEFVQDTPAVNPSLIMYLLN